MSELDPRALGILSEMPLVGPDGYDPHWDDLMQEIPPLGEAARHFDRLGNPISMRTWCRLIGDPEHRYQRVAETQVGPYWISTVWLGLDHGFLRGDPLIFETMGFNADRDDVGEVYRYSTEKDALAGHLEIVERVQLLWEATKP